MKRYGSAISVRGDCLYCPLSLSIDSYWNCLVNCHHCYMRRLNHVWGTDLRPADPVAIRKKLKAGLRNKNPRSNLAWALKNKQTIRLGNKTDPFQPIELTHKISHKILTTLVSLKWSFVIQTRFLSVLQTEEKLLQDAHQLGLLTIMPVIGPGMEWDWEVLERKRTTPIPERLKIIKRFVKKGYNVGVNGEPFIPGIHTLPQFRDTIRRLKDVGVKSYNTYNLHFNDYVAKRLHAIGLDITKIWEMNQDRRWKRIQRTLCATALKEGIRLGCPDFVNTGPDWIEQANTCCGVNVPNPSKFNAHHWKQLLQDNFSPDQILKGTYQGVGDKDNARKIINGKRCGLYTMKDAGVLQ